MEAINIRIITHRDRHWIPTEGELIGSHHPRTHFSISYHHTIDYTGSTLLFAPLDRHVYDWIGFGCILALQLICNPINAVTDLIMLVICFGSGIATLGKRLLYAR